MVKKKIIDLETYDRTSPVEDVIIALLKFYIKYNGDELKISPAVERPAGCGEYEYGVYCLQGNRMDLMVPPPNNIVPKILPYVKVNSGLKNQEQSTLYVRHEGVDYTVPFSLEINNQYHKEEITFGKPKKLEQRV